MDNESVEVLLYYGFAAITDPEAFAAQHEALCRDLGLLGRIYIAREGINGTCAGPLAATHAYRDALRATPGFEDIAFKVDHATVVPFEKLRVRVRPTIVNLGLERDIVPAEEGGDYVEPAEWRAMLDGDEPYVLLDVRNGFEWDVGHFRGAVRAPFERFHEFPKWAAQLDIPKDTRVLMYCTGGIRCEKFSGLLRREGFENVGQLHGGILRYAAEQGGEHFEGDCFVFDDRLRVDIGGSANTWSRCAHCGALSTRPQNCANMDCHTLFVCCEACAMAEHATCSAACRKAPRLRRFDAEHLHRPFRSKGRELPDRGASNGSASG
jgi:UPF0176 protein